MKMISTALFIFFLLGPVSAWADTQTTTNVSQDSNNTSVTTTTTTTTVDTKQDEAIVAAIFAKYAKDPALIGTTLNVTSKGGIVTLTGKVTAQSQEDQAILSAKSVPGVQDVRSQIDVITNRTVPPINKVPNY